MAQPVESYDSTALDLAAPIDRAIEQAEHGTVTYLHHRKQEKVAIMPAKLAHQALEALEDAEDLAAMAATDGEPRRSFENVARELGI